MNKASTNNPVINEIGNRLVGRLKCIKKEFNNILDISNDFNNTKSSIKYEDETFDLILSNLTFSLSSNMHKSLLKAGKSLKKDGLLLATVLGPESFKEIKQSFYGAGSKNGHVALFADVQSYGEILQQLKFTMPVVDKEEIIIHYNNFTELWEDIRNIGKFNTHPEKQKGLMTPKLWKKMEKYYWENFSTQEGYIPLTLEIIYIAGWRADKSQQKPLPMGTKAIPLSQILK